MSNDVSSAANAPRTFTLSKRAFLVRRLSVREFSAVLRDDVLRAYREGVRAMADELSLIGNTRIEFLSKSVANAPSGPELDIEVARWIYSTRGIPRVIQLATLSIDGEKIGGGPEGEHRKPTLEEVAEVVLNAKGPDAEQALADMIDFIRDGFIDGEKKSSEPSKS